MMHAFLSWWDHIPYILRAGGFVLVTIIVGYHSFTPRSKDRG